MTDGDKVWAVVVRYATAEEVHALNLIFEQIIDRIDKQQEDS